MWNLCALRMAKRPAIFVDLQYFFLPFKQWTAILFLACARALAQQCRSSQQQSF
jgi:hypothetical protein